MLRFTFVAAMSLALLAPLAGGCSRTVAHSEHEKVNSSGTRTREETTTYKNPDGTYRTETSKSRTSN
jgi:hypothetical protein